MCLLYIRHGNITEPDAVRKDVTRSIPSKHDIYLPTYSIWSDALSFILFRVYEINKANLLVFFT